MKTIICLGTKACDIGEAHEALSEPLKIKLLDIDIEGENCFSIAPQKSAEEYEKNTPDLTSFFNDITDDVLFIVSGETPAANCSLKILQQIKHKKITIVYLLPQLEFLTLKQVIQERVIRGVLQEYARSGLFNNIVLINCNLVESVMNETSIKDYDSQFNLTILNILKNYRSLDIIQPVINNANKPKEVSRIIGFGYYDFINDIERPLYNMQMIDDKIYHFFFSEQTLNSNAKTLRELKEKLKNKAVDNTKISYTINSSSTQHDYCFVTYYTKAIQH